MSKAPRHVRVAASDGVARGITHVAASDEETVREERMTSGGQALHEKATATGTDPAPSQRIKASLRLLIQVKLLRSSLQDARHSPREYKPGLRRSFKRVAGLDMLQQSAACIFDQA